MFGEIQVKDFPDFVRLNPTKDFREEIFVEALEKIGGHALDTKELLSLIDSNHSIYGQAKYEFLFGGLEGRIIQALEQSPLKGTELIQKTGLSRNTFYHKISRMRRKGRVGRRNGRYELLNPLHDIVFSDLGKVHSLAPEQRRKKRLSKNEIALALYLWPRYKEACTEEGIDWQASRYAVTYANIFSLANAVKRWKKGKSNIPKWALVAIAELAQKDDKLNEEGTIQSYSLPPGTEVVPFYDGKYKIPIEVGEELDILVSQLLAKGSVSGKQYSRKNKEKFFRRLHDVFGFFESKKRIPLAIIEIIKKYYAIPYFNRKEARIPPRIIERIGKLKDPEKMEYEAALLNGMIELGSEYRGYCEVTSQSKEFLIDVSEIAEDLGIGRLTISKRLNRPHYRCEISLKKAAIVLKKIEHLKKLYENLEKIYPDFKIWDRIPLNNMRERVRNKDLAKPVEVLQEICKVELSRYLGLVLESIDRNTPKYVYVPYIRGKRKIKINTPELLEEITDYYWNDKKVPSARNVREHLSNPKSA